MSRQRSQRPSIISLQGSNFNSHSIPPLRILNSLGIDSKFQNRRYRIAKMSMGGRKFRIRKKVLKWMKGTFLRKRLNEG